jgi:hypothetical protein
MNDLRQLIANYTADRPAESYASIGRRGSTPGDVVPTQSVHALATGSEMCRPEGRGLAGAVRGRPHA